MLGRGRRRPIRPKPATFPIGRLLASFKRIPLGNRRRAHMRALLAYRHEGGRNNKGLGTALARAHHLVVVEMVYATHRHSVPIDDIAVRHRCRAQVPTRALQAVANRLQSCVRISMQHSLRWALAGVEWGELKAGDRPSPASVSGKWKCPDRDKTRMLGT
jgi:hypothetical protein